MLLLLPQLPLLLQPLFQLLPQSLLFVKPGLQDFTPMSKCETKVRKQPTNEAEITWKACMLATGISGRGSIRGVESVVLARSWERVGVLAVSTTLSPSQYRLCFFPPPALMMASPERGAVAESHVSPWSAFPISMYRVTRVWMFGLLQASGGAAGSNATSDVALPM